VEVSENDDEEGMNNSNSESIQSQEIIEISDAEDDNDGNSSNDHESVMDMCENKDDSDEEVRTEETLEVTNSTNEDEDESYLEGTNNRGRKQQATVGRNTRSASRRNDDENSGYDESEQETVDDNGDNDETYHGHLGRNQRQKQRKTGITTRSKDKKLKKQVAVESESESEGEEHDDEDGEEEENENSDESSVESIRSVSSDKASYSEDTTDKLGEGGFVGSYFFDNDMVMNGDDTASDSDASSRSSSSASHASSPPSSPSSSPPLPPRRGRNTRSVPSVAVKGKGKGKTLKTKPVTLTEINHDESIRLLAFSFYKEALESFITEKVFSKLRTASKSKEKLPFSKSLLLQEQPETIMNCTLRNYQLDGVNWLIENYCKRINCILADEM
jgi:SNF2 family DNA or RNA helicase